MRWELQSRRQQIINLLIYHYKIPGSNNIIIFRDSQGITCFLPVMVTTPTSLVLRSD